MDDNLTINICSKNSLPKYATQGSAGIDLVAYLEEAIILKPMQRALVDTGICLAIPDGFEGQVRPRSGLAIKYGITVLNAPGTIDSDYRGEIKVPLINLGDENFEINNGMRIAQLVVASYIRINLNLVQKLEPSSSRGDKGFGSTGNF